MSTGADGDKGSNLVLHVGHGLREAALIAMLALAAFLALALATYSSQDPSWSDTGVEGAVRNLAGASGAWTADVLLAGFGMMAFGVPMALVAVGVRRFRTRLVSGGSDWLTIGVRLLGAVLTLASGCALLALHVAPIPGAWPAGPGGLIGRWLGAFAYESFNTTGGTLLAMATVLLGVTLATGLSWIALMESIGRLVFRGAHAVRAGGAALAEALRKRREARRAIRDQRRQAHQAQSQRRAKVVRETRRKAERAPPEIAPAPAKPQPSERAHREKQKQLFPPPAQGTLPQLSLLDAVDDQHQHGYSQASLEALSRMLELKLKDFKVDAEVTAVHPGPVITRFEIQPAAGVKVSRISGLAKDLARSLAVISVRVVEVIPGKSTVGIEIPNEHREVIRLREVLGARSYDQASSALSLALGKDIGGAPVVVDLAKMPHLLVAGTTGSGKSVGVNSMLLSLLFKATPEEVRLILVDPKMLELSIYEGIPHLLTPVVTDMKEAASALRWSVAEMERRYKLMAALGVRNLAGYNRKVRDAIKAGEPLADPLAGTSAPSSADDRAPEQATLQPLPYIVVVIDEFADMMMIVGKKVEELIARIAQKARAAGIHLILATQRPSVDVITGLIKANIPTRISFQVSSKVDSRTILDQGGAEQLLGHGDMLYTPAGSAMPMRVHGAFVADDEVHRVVGDWKQRGEPDYLEEVLAGGGDVEGVPDIGTGNGAGGDAEQEDPLYDQAVTFVLESRRASISAVQRKLRIGYNRAARLVEAMEASGVVSGMDPSGAREVLVPKREE